MTLVSQEHYDIMAMFEREFKGQFRLDREEKRWWPMGRVYQHGEANIAFLAYRRGYAYGRALERTA